eukprot:scaffold248218_cov35-Tisochrysis_lutea.AAC.3
MHAGVKTSQNIAAQRRQQSRIRTCNASGPVDPWEGRLRIGALHRVGAAAGTWKGGGERLGGGSRGLGGVVTVR